ncbi:unnamed protein product [marine sediment metagenome]|uniref:Uncharacterized protein n=1 Tax=marine sediment metagenome TaxID=412755 RepID=X1SLX2_9ZZZZ
MANLKCPCCGKELHQVASTDAFVEQLTRAFREHPEDVGGKVSTREDGTIVIDLHQGGKSE